MSHTLTSNWRSAAITAALLSLAFGVTAGADSFFENFDAATGTGGGIFLDGRGFSALEDWDDGLLNETAFGSTSGHANAILSAQGAPGLGVSGGAGLLEIIDVNFNFIDEDFSSVTGTGGGVFLIGDGNTPDLTGYTGAWDDGLGDEFAFFGTANGAILVGDVSAQGIPGGGATDGGGQMIVNNVNVTAGEWYGGLAWTVPGFPAGAAPVLVNGGFDVDGTIPPGGDPTITGWTLGGDAMWFQGGPSWEGSVYLEPSQMPPISPAHALKIWCAWQVGYPNESTVYQDLAATEGQTWELDCFVANYSGDPLATNNTAEMRIEFYDPNDNLLGTPAVATILTVSDPIDTWIDVTPLSAVAPAGTAYARAVLAYVAPVAPAGNCGAAFIEDVTFEVTDGPPSFNLGDFSLTADVRGEALGAGEQLGHYQLRLEDSSGGRLVFTSTAVADPNAWTPIGGTLDLADERDANDVPTPGAFDPSSSNFTVVVAFDNNRATTWGTGGTLEVDNILMPNTVQTGSGYVAGLYWDGIPAEAEVDPRNLQLTADLLGDVAGGDYQLRMEVFGDIPYVNENFSTLTGEGGDQLKAPNDENGYVETGDWDTGIDFEFGFAGTFEGAVVTTPAGGIWIEGDLAEGAAKLEAHEIAVGGLAGWYVGAGWRDQALASTDPNLVTLTASIKGDASGALESLGTVQLRIEDPDLDYIGFEQMATTGWQPIGGALSTTNASGALGSGDGVFDWNAESYTVAVVFEGTDSNWNWGGTVWVDNVQITEPANPVRTQRGQISFSGSANGSTYDSVGGLLIDGDSSFPPVGGVIQDGNANWERGIEGEAAFFGGWLASIAQVEAQGCTDCGMSGTGGAQLIATGITHDDPNGTYWAGLAWHNIPIDISDPNLVRFTADVKGEWDTSGGTLAGYTVIRLEDGNGGNFGFELQADGAWHAIGGTMNTAIDYNGFNKATTQVSVVLIIYTHDSDEGPNATISLDNLRLEYNDPVNGWTDVLYENFDTAVGPTPGYLDDAGSFDTYTLVATMENGLTTWPAGGSLLIDNLSLGGLPQYELGDLNCDGFVNNGDIDAFVLALNDPGVYASAYPDCDINLADINDDGFVNNGDIDPFVALLSG